MPLCGFRCLSSFYLFILGFLVIWSSPESVSASSRSSTTQEVLFPVRALQQPSLLFQCIPGSFFLVVSLYFVKMNGFVSRLFSLPYLSPLWLPAITI